MKRLLLLLVAIALCAPAGFSAESPASEEQKEPRRLISLDFPETSLSTVLDVLSLKTGRKFITDSDLARKKIVLSLRDVTPEEALNALLDTYNLYYVR
ncbi:MAG: STN domain-containing protein, partial [Endomicrobiales bacterium]